jgi:hypothetical protein
MPCRSNGPIGNYVYDAEGHRERRAAGSVDGHRTHGDAWLLCDIEHESGAWPVARGSGCFGHQPCCGRRASAWRRVLWPNQNPLGRHILNVRDEPTPAVWVPSAAVTVVGIVNNTREGSLASGFGDEVYLPITPDHEMPTMYVLLRTRASTLEAASAIRRAVADLDPQVPVTRVRSLNEVMASSESGPRSLTILLLVFGGLAVVIGGVGVYSLIAYIVSWRRREIGIRLALGAQRWQIVGGVVRQSLILALGGSAAGLAVAALVAQVMRGFLFGVTCRRSGDVLRCAGADDGAGTDGGVDSCAAGGECGSDDDVEDASERRLASCRVLQRRSRAV